MSARRWATAAVLAWLGGVGCTAILGVSDLPPATTPDGGARDATSSDVSRADRTAHDAGNDSAVDATHHDAAVDARAAPEASLDAPPGDGGQVASFEVTPLSLAFGDGGLIPCGTTTPETLDVTLANHTKADVTWWTSFGLGAASPFQISRHCTMSAPCTLLTAGDAATATIEVTGPAVPSDAGMENYGDTLTIFSSADGGTSATVTLRAASYGAVVSFGQSNVSFGTQPASQPEGGYPATVALDNSGNAPFQGSLRLSETVADGGRDALEFGLTRIADAAVGDATVQLAASSQAPVVVSFDPEGSSADGGANGTLALASTSVLCAPLPGPLPLSGRGSASDISVPAVLNFNTANAVGRPPGIGCGQTPKSETLQILNTGPAAQIVSLTLGQTSSLFAPPTLPLGIASGSPSSPSTTDLVIDVAPVPATSFPGQVLDDVLTVVTQVGGAGFVTNTVLLELTAAGTQFDVPQKSVVFPTVMPDQLSRQLLFIENTGTVNIPALRTTNTPTNSDLTWLPNGLPPEQNVPPTQGQCTAAAGAPPGVTTFSFTPSASMPVCGGFDGSVGASYSIGVVTNVYDQVGQQNSLTFRQQCPPLNGQGANQTSPPITLENAFDGAAHASFTATISGRDTTFFSVAPSSGSLLLGSKATLTVTANGVSQSSGLTQNQVAYGLNAVLDITVSGTNTEEFEIPINEQLVGSLFTWSTGGSALAVPNGAAAALTLYDWGSGGAEVTLTSSTPGLALSQTTGDPRLGFPLTTVVLDEGATGSPTIDVGLNDPSAQMCGPLPAAVGVTIQ